MEVRSRRAARPPTGRCHSWLQRGKVAWRLLSGDTTLAVNRGRWCDVGLPLAAKYAAGILLGKRVLEETALLRAHRPRSSRGLPDLQPCEVERDLLDLGVLEPDPLSCQDRWQGGSANASQCFKLPYQTPAARVQGLSTASHHRSPGRQSRFCSSGTRFTEVLIANWPRCCAAAHEMRSPSYRACARPPRASARGNPASRKESDRAFRKRPPNKAQPLSGPG
jgi:hypothetical protein